MDLVKLVTGREMAQIDRHAIDGLGVPGVELMERAGRRVHEAVAERWGGPEDLTAVVLCGKGNNGGDGFVVARLLRAAGAKVKVFLAAARDAVRGDALQQLRRHEEAGGCVAALSDPDDWRALDEALAAADLAVDALLGTGLRGAVAGDLARAIERLNAAGKPVVAVDMPSGVEADTGAVHGPAVCAALTVTFGLPKIGQLFYPGRAQCGVLQLTDIGYPPEVIERCPSRIRLLTEDRVAGWIPARPGNAHKGTCGSVAVVAGSAGMTGAAALTADTALLAGAGKVILGAPASLHDVLEAKLTEVMTRPLPEVRRHRCLARRALGDVLRLLDGTDCLALGPGLGRHRETAALVRELLPRAGVPVVLDADGLNALAGEPRCLEVPAPLVLTPHAGEFARLSGCRPERVASEPLAVAGEFAQRHGLTLVLKGAPTVVALADGRVATNPTGNPGMATAGAGDVLTGLIAGLIAQGVEPRRAACLGAFLHGRAGDLARDRRGVWGMKASDISQAVPEAMLATHRAHSAPT
jgi:NAD(P)H-hydrate epimerase